MSRVGVLAALCLALVGRPAAAQRDPEPKDGKVTFALTLSPADVRKPVADYYLLPEYRDLRPGDKLSGFLKCFMEQDVFFNRENSEKREKWLEMPLAELPSDVRQQASIHGGIAYGPKYANFMVFLDQAARYNRVEWNEYFNLRRDGVYMLLPEIQKLRALAQVLRLRMRGEVKTGEFDRALATAKTLFGLAKLLESHPTLIGNLVGIAVATIALQGLEEMVQQPGCPNLYWSFTDLPVPFMSLREALSGERLFVAAHFDVVTKANRPLSDKELDAFFKELEDIVKSSGETVAVMDNPRVRYALLAADEKRTAAGRERLIRSGMPAEVAKALPAVQVAITEDVHHYDILRDDVLRWLHLPYPVAAKGVAVEEDRVKKEKSARTTYLAPLFLPAVLKVKQAQVRLDQRIAYLRVIEAVRLHAHENGGRLPGSLDDIKVPVPADPITGGPFEYAVKDGVATLHGANPNPGAERTNRYYEIRIRK